MLAHHLISVLNVTFLDLNDDYNLSRINKLTSFHVIVWASDRNSAQLVTESVQRRIKDFTMKGGVFIMLTPWPEWADEIVGFHYSDEKTKHNPIDYVYFNHPIILKSYLNISRDMDYRWENKVYPTGVNITYIVRDTNDQPLLSMSSYGLGYGILCATPVSTLSETVNSYTTIIINTIFYACGKEVLPILWHKGFIQETTPKGRLQYSISGKPGGPLLLWIVNNGPVTNFEIHLNASFFGLNSKGWIALDVANLQLVAQGQGNDISISVPVNNMSWLPIYIMNNTQEHRLLYSNLPAVVQNTYPNQALYKICTTLGQDMLLIVRSSVVPNEITINNYLIKSTTEFSAILYESNEDSYFYDLQNGLIYIRAKARERNITVRIVFKETQYILSIFEENKQFINVLLILSVVLVELYAINRTRRSIGGK
jgi:hypothetical protein